MKLSFTMLVGAFLCSSLQAQISSVTRKTPQGAVPAGFRETFAVSPATNPGIVAVREPSPAEKEALVRRTVEFQKKRAVDGSAVSQYDLGLRFLGGDGVEQNSEEGLRLLKQSAAQDYTPAKQKLAQLEKVSVKPTTPGADSK
jgi:TPR repeat protein